MHKCSSHSQLLCFLILCTSSLTLCSHPESSSPNLALTPQKSKVTCLCPTALRSRQVCLFLQAQVSHPRPPTTPNPAPRVDCPPLLELFSPIKKLPRLTPALVLHHLDRHPTQCLGLTAADVQPKPVFPPNHPFVQGALQAGTGSPYPSPPGDALMPLPGEAVSTLYHPPPS